MDTTINPSGTFRYSTVITDIAALVFVGLVPAASHLFKFPVYYIEPMRVMLILALLYSSRWNAYALAIVLPLFSFLVSGHPSPVKMMIIMAELVFNTWLFLYFYQKTRKSFLSAFSSIVISKVFCYAMYLVVFSMAFVKDEAGITFLFAQMILTIVLSILVWIILTRRSSRIE
ncbi:MAG: hypothetical protein Q7U54_08990 [Bacteroidales bacterium]|nr:hypothetical protein [Bacteroidales bacterium]